METRANYILIGAFTLAVLVAGFGFVFWFSRSGNEAERATYRVVFDGSVSGLRTGGVVLFNGIKVGEVTDLKLNPQDPRQAIATIGIDKSIPIRADTRANLAYQGLTGIASVALKGGQADAPLLPTRVGEVPTSSAEASAVQDLEQGSRYIMGRADSILRRVDIFLADNESGVRNVVRNIEKFTGALGDNSNDVAAFIKDAAAAARRIAVLSDNIDKLAGDLSDLVKAVDPSKVASMVDNVDKVIKAMDPNKVAGVIDNAETLTKGLAASTDQIVAFVEDARSVAAKLNDIAGKLDPTLDRVGDIVKAIDPGKVASVVDNVDKVIGAIDPDRVAGAIDSVDRIVKAIDPSKLASVIDNADVFTQSLAGSSEKITAFMNDAQALAGRLKDMSDRLDPTVTRLGEVVGAVDPQRVQRTVENVERFTDALGRNSVNVDSLLNDAADVARKFNDMSASIDSTLKRANDVLQAVDPQKIERTVANVDK